MFERSLQSIEKPGRYIGGEGNACTKSFHKADVRFALAFPDVYEVGMSHLGIQLLYHLLNGMDGVMADRVYAPWFDFERELRNAREPLRALESGESLAGFDFIGFSLQYELSYTNILTMLDLAGVPLRASGRRPGDPFVVGGGPCAFNPEPVAEFFDFFVLGEAEELLEELIAAHRDWRRSGGSRQAFLERISEIEGIYVPSFFHISYDPQGVIESIRPLHAGYTSVRKRIIQDLDTGSPLPEKPLVPLVDIVHNRLGLEIARGCTRGCRFCQAGFIYRPVRERNPDAVLRNAEIALHNSGFEDLALLSLSTGDYCCVQPLLAALMERFSDDRVAVSFPSMRVGTLTPELMELVQKVRKTGFTLAPEAGSERLRRVINKGILDEDLLDAAENAYRFGWRLLKLYFMIGLPTETEADHDALVELCHRVWELGKRSKAALNIAVSTFVPKPMTPFQWSAQIRRDEVEQRLDHLRERLKKPGMRFKWHHPGHSILEGVFARGDRRLARVIERAWSLGVRFDGWTEHFREDLWMEAFHLEGVSPDFYTHRQRSCDEMLPWDHLSAGVDQEFLWKEYERALGEAFTPDCRWNPCSGCGVCDHVDVMPLLHREPLAPLSEGLRTTSGQPGAAHVYRLVYSKLGMLRFIGQLELTQSLSRAVRRAGLPAEYSRGFHPHMKLSFNEALPLGMESEVAEAFLSLTEPVDEEEMKRRLNACLPAGMEIREVALVTGKKRGSGPKRVTYRITELGRDRVCRVMRDWPQKLDETLVKKTKKGALSAPLREILLGVSSRDDGSIEMDVLEAAQIFVRPATILQHLLGEPLEDFSACRTRKVAVSQLSEWEGRENVCRAGDQC